MSTLALDNEVSDQVKACENIRGRGDSIKKKITKLIPFY